ncbi:hypothetical protein GCM10025768_21480 [Microbacterium pseudoresistens]|uniref:Multiple sugar transport system substrate-binding protein n=1 Tax=Microbacterium pseudoresistens TaxID=640634 RepID=A0A7Y9ET33_9MICO|nr:extracellular solute-binding protein [Microbacterium pseudoresistens]NYD53445.1 multiple sugar transport system substrate-binding protein [Microbacterium pseudoresistens]
MRSSRAIAIGAAFLTAVSLAGCSASGGGDDANADGTETIKMVAWPGPEGDAMAKVIDAYNDGQGKKDKIHVELVLLSRQDTFSKETALMASKDGDLDIYWTASYNVGQFSGSLEPLEGIDTSNYFPVAVDGLTYKDELYALPLDVSNHFLLYRTDLIDTLLNDPAAAATYSALAQDILGEARQPVPADQWDLDDFQVMAAYFSTSANPASPTQYGTILQAKNLLYNTMIWNDVLWGLGGSWTDDDGKAAIDTAEGKAAVQLYADIYKNGWTSPDSAQAEFPETQAALQSGNVAFAIQWSAAFAALNDPEQSPDIAGKIGIAPVPGGQTHVHALSLSLNKYGDSQDAAKTVLSYLATTDAMTAYAQAGGIPAMPEVLKANVDLNPAFNEVATSIADYGYAEPVFPKTFQAYSKLAEDLSGAWVGQTSVDDAVETANANLQELLDQ